MGIFRRRTNYIPFSLVDLTEFYANFRDGAIASASRRAFRILDRAVNGQPDGLREGLDLDTPLSEEADTKLGEMYDKIKALVEHNEKLLGREDVKKLSAIPPNETAAQKKKREEEGAKVKAELEAKLENPGEAGVTLSSEEGLEAVPWILFIELAYLILKAIQEYRQKKRESTK